MQQGLTTLSVAPVLDRELAAALLGADAAESVCAAALDVGILVERERSSTSIHSRARFSRSEARNLGLIPAAGAAATCLDMLPNPPRVGCGIRRSSFASGAVAELEELMRRALDELLDTARLVDTHEVVRSCGRRASTHRSSRLHAPRSCFGAAVTSRQSRMPRRLQPASQRSSSARSRSPDGPLTCASREEDALALYRRAEGAASNEVETPRRQVGPGYVSC